MGIISPETAVLQRVKSASVTVDDQLISSIGKGLLVLAAVEKDDTDKDAASMAAKILKAKLWDDEDKEPVGKWKKGVADIGGEVLCGSEALSMQSDGRLLSLHSVPVHSTSLYEEGEQAQLPSICSRSCRQDHV
jgi:D-tyrosyl-tRNA(Tyr) deacylase